MSSSSAKLAAQLIERVKNLKKHTVMLKIDGFTGHGPVPFDLKITKGLATVTVLATDMLDAKRQVSAYFGSDDWVD